MNEVVILGITFLSSFLITKIIAKLSNDKQWFDVPNERSSHTLPTPKSGGLAFVLVFYCALIYAFFREVIEIREFLALSMSIIVAGLGLIDDLIPINNKIRLGIQIVAIGIVLKILNGIPLIPFFSYQLSFGVVGIVITVIVFTWFVNLYNFMDGIDGLAALEGIFICLAASFFCWYQGEENIALVFNYLIAALLGFLVLNWPPAKIFMGDIGSTFLGLILGIFGLITMNEGVMSIWTWAIILGAFIVDSTNTLLQRFIDGEVWYHAHRSHCYQQAAIKFNSHQKVDLALTAINFFWLFPLAWVSVIFEAWGLIMVLIAYLPLIYLCRSKSALGRWKPSV